MRLDFGRLARSLAVFLAGAAPVAAQVTSRISVGSGNTQGNGDSTFSLWPSAAISADGRYVAFESLASNLIAGDPSGPGVFVRDRQLGTIERVSVSSGGAAGNGESYTPSISADGRFVAFGSTSSNLVSGDSNGWPDTFVRDRQSGTTERVSVDSSEVQADYTSGYATPAISADGRFVAFQSEASNLVSGDTNGAQDIFVRDRQLGTTERVSVDSGGTEGNSFSYVPAISSDGRFVAFASSSSNFAAGDTNGVNDVFVRDRLNGTTELVSVDLGGVPGNSDSITPAISGDGRYVAFESFASNLVGGDTNQTGDIFVRDRLNGSTRRVSLDTSGVEAWAECSHPSITADGRYVAFETLSNIFSGDLSRVDVYVYDRLSSTPERISLDSAGAPGDQDCNHAAISADGRCVAFQSRSTNLVGGDTNAASDIFVRERTYVLAFASLCHPGTDGWIACPCSNPPASVGRGCDNSAGTGGAVLSASGIAYLSQDTLVFTTSGERPTATSIVLQGTSTPSGGIVYGQGVRCVAGTLKRLYTKSASGGSITAPNFGAGDPSVSARSATLGNPIQPGQSRWYLVYYRDPNILGGCSSVSTFNATQTGRVDWLP